MVMVDLPPPPVAIVRTVEEMGIQSHETIATKIVNTADIVLEKFNSGDKSPTHNEVTFVAANKKNRCQQNVRQLLEAAAIFGIKGKWKEASCCAGQTRKNMHKAALNDKYIEITDINKVRKGDLVYLGGGGICSDCGSNVGHVMVCTGRAKDGTLLMWQNTTLGNRKLCEIPLIQNQSDRFISAYRFKPRVLKRIKTVVVKRNFSKQHFLKQEESLFSYNLNKNIIFGGKNGMSKLLF